MPEIFKRTSFEDAKKIRASSIGRGLNLNVSFYRSCGTHREVYNIYTQRRQVDKFVIYWVVILRFIDIAFEKYETERQVKRTRFTGYINMKPFCIIRQFYKYNIYTYMYLCIMNNENHIKIKIYLKQRALCANAHNMRTIWMNYLSKQFTIQKLSFSLELELYFCV